MYKHISDKSKECLSVGNSGIPSVCRRRLCPRFSLHQLIYRSEIFTKSYVYYRRIFDFLGRSATLPYVWKIIWQKRAAFAFGSTYFHQTFAEFMSNQYTLFDISTWQMWLHVTECPLMLLRLWAFWYTCP